MQAQCKRIETFKVKHTAGFSLFLELCLHEKLSTLGSQRWTTPHALLADYLCFWHNEIVIYSDVSMASMSTTGDICDSIAADAAGVILYPWQNRNTHTLPLLHSHCRKQCFVESKRQNYCISVVINKHSTTGLGPGIYIYFVLGVYLIAINLGIVCSWNYFSAYLLFFRPWYFDLLKEGNFQLRFQFGLYLITIRFGYDYRHF